MTSVYYGLSTLKDLHQNVENLHGTTFEKVLPGKLGGFVTSNFYLCVKFSIAKYFLNPDFLDIIPTGVLYSKIFEI